MDRPHLAVVNTDTGELGDALCPECLQKDAAITRLTRSYEGTIRNLKQEIGRITPDDENVRMVLDYWADRAVELGWWSRRPLFEPGDERWQPVRGRLRTRTVDESYLAIEGAFSQSKHQTKRAYVDATSIFRNNKNFEQHLERAVDVDMENVRVRRQLPPELAGMDEERLAALSRRCDCFMGEERFLTPEGPRSFVETAGTEQTVLTRAGWALAQIRGFGVRDVQLVQFMPGHMVRGAERAIRSTRPRSVAVTTSHPWIRVDGSVTTALAEGDSVPAVAVPPRRHVEEFVAGMRHGLVFGDGYHAKSNPRRRDGSARYVVELQGERTAAYAGVFDTLHDYPSRRRTQPHYRGTGIVWSPTDLKAVPEAEASTDYLAGFVDGWLAADGSMRGETWRVVSVNWEAVDWLWRFAPLAGYIPTGRGQDTNTATNLGKRSRPLRWVTLRAQPTIWRVREIKPLGRAETFCAVVPGRDEFVLEGGILTHNCTHLLMEHYAPSPPLGKEPCRLCGCGQFLSDEEDLVAWAKREGGEREA